MKVVVNNGFYFSGKVRDLLKELQLVSKEYKTLRELIAKTTH